MNATCPCCFQPLPRTALRVDLDNNVALYEGRALFLGPVETEIMSVLHDAVPEWAVKDRIMHRVYGAGEMPMDKTLTVHIAHINRKLKDIGFPFVIESSWYCGGGAGKYRLRREAA